jgi:hypothetical protein
MKTVELSQTASPAPRAHLPEALPVGESNPALHRELSVLAGEVIKDALSLIHLPNLPDTYVEERLKRRAAMVLALLYTSEPSEIENFNEYAEEMLTMAVFSEIMELQA